MDDWPGAIALGGIVSSFVFWNQLGVMQGQLKEMESTGKQTETLIETNKQLADAAKRSANVAEKALKITQRACFVVSPKLTGFEANGRPKASVLIRNIGITPAYSVNLKTFIGIAQYPFPDDLRLPDQVSGQVVAPVITKDEAITGNITMSIPLETDRFEKIDKELDFRLIIWAFIDFDDAFGCKIKRNVCFLYGGEAARKGQDPELCGGARNEEKYTGECRP